MPKLLVADDDAVMRDLVARALQGEGHQIAVAADGQEALDFILADPAAVALLIADVDMPALDGVALAEKAQAAAPGLKVLLMSGHAGGSARAGGLLARDGVDFISKPFTIESLRTAVRKSLS